MATVKQQLVVKDLLENTGKPVSVAMLDAGYAPATAKNPSELTESKGWAELMEQFLPDAKLAQVHNGLLEATKIHTSHTEPDREVPDWQARAKGLDMAYDLKKKRPEKVSGVEITEGDKTIRVVVQDYK